MRGRYVVLIVFLVLAVAFGFDLSRFARSLSHGSVDLPHEKVDLIVALTGGQGRLREAVNFLEQDRGRYLFISGTTPGTTLKSIFTANKITAPIDALKDRIFLDERARSTVGNAIEVRYIVERLKAESLLLVTSTYHIKRARELVERSLQREPALQVRIFEAGVASPNFVSETWHRSPVGWQILLSEYFKSRLGF